jgi:hypothetical protein
VFAAVSVGGFAVYRYGNLLSSDSSGSAATADTAVQKVESESEIESGIEAQTAIEANADVGLDIGTDIGTEGEEAAAEGRTESTSVTSGSTSLEPGNGTDNMADKADKLSGNQETADELQTSDKNTDNGSSQNEADKTQNSANTENTSSVADSRKKVSLTEARSTENVGKHIPTLIPDGYSLDSCRKMSDASNYNDVYVRWTDKDGGYIHVEITDYYLIYDDLIITDYVRSSEITLEDVESRCVQGSNGTASFVSNIVFDDGVFATISVGADLTSAQILEIIQSM